MTSPIKSARGMIATSHPEASRVGVEILRAGGNAIDAAIAANAALGAIEPHMCGVGGDLMAFVWSAKEQKLFAFNGQGRSPRALTLDVYAERGITALELRDPLTMTVPGCVEGWHQLIERFGCRSLSELLQPAIKLAEEGCPVPAFIASQWSLLGLENSTDAMATYCPDGRSINEGEIFKNLRLASTYRTLAADWRAIYEGDLARSIETMSREQGGLLTVEDLANHRGEWVEPLATTYRGATVYALPSPTQAPCVTQMLNFLENEDLAAMGLGSAEATHCMVEAKKLSYEDRARFIADPDVEPNLPTDRFTSKAFAAERWRLFNPHAALQSIPRDPAERSDTTYLCAADEEGNSISLIQSIYCRWGSGFAPQDSGFVIQNRGWGFSLDPHHPCCAGPAKRPLHTIIPGFATRDGKPWMCFGVMGGPMQPQGQVQIMVNMLDHGLDVQSAGEAPRWRHEGSSELDGSTLTDGGEVFLEEAFCEETRAAMRDFGHRLGTGDQTYGGYQAIEFDHGEGLMRGGSDPRKDGCAMGL